MPSTTILVEEGRGAVEEGHGAGLALAAAGGLGAGVLLSGFLYGLPLSSLIFSAVFVAIAVERDVRTLRIPNWLTFPGLALAIALGVHAAGLGGMADALLGALLALGLLVLPYAAGGLGAGDVKAMMVLGALYGVGAVLPILAWSLGIGAALGLALVTLKGGLPMLLRRWRRILRHSAGARSWIYSQPEPGSAEALGLPFAVALGIGIVAFHVARIPL